MMSIREVKNGDFVRQKKRTSKKYYMQLYGYVITIYLQRIYLQKNKACIIFHSFCGYLYLREVSNTYFHSIHTSNI